MKVCVSKRKAHIEIRYSIIAEVCMIKVTCRNSVLKDVLKYTMQHGSSSHVIYLKPNQGFFLKKIRCLGQAKLVQAVCFMLYQVRLFFLVQLQLLQQLQCNMNSDYLGVLTLYNSALVMLFNQKPIFPLRPLRGLHSRIHF